MANDETIWIKLFIGFGILTIISRIYLVIQKDCVSGILGSVVGAFIILLNSKGLRKISN